MSRRTRKRFPSTFVAKGYRPRRIPARDVGKVKCEKIRDNWLCAHAGKYGVSVRLYAKGESPPRDSADWYRGGKWVPISDGGARTVKAGLRAGRQSWRRVKMKSAR